jgi:hypothetical protein
MAEDGEIDRWRRYVPGNGSDDDLQALRALFAGYTEAEIRRRLNIPDLEADSMPPLDALIRLFHEGLYATEDELPADVLALLDRLGLIARDRECPGLVYSTATILRVAGELNVCDRGGAPDGSTYPLQPDVVYPPIFDNTCRYLAGLPSTPCEAMLEIGTGAGMGAILGARHARRVWATDINARAVLFARLSCRLAGLDNVTVLEGDLYSPVEGLTFDRIAIHPPWAPATQSEFIFGDGGEDGETIIRGSIERLPQFLLPGGRFYAMLLASDRQGEKFEERVRSWLGPGREQFDIAVAEFSRDSTHGFLAQNLAKGSISEGAIRFWLDLWKATATEAMVYGMMIVQRHQGEREPVTVRAQTGIDYSARHLEDLLDWEMLVRSPGAAEKLLASRPLVSPHSALKTTSRVHNGSFTTEAMALECSGPFRSVFACEWWLARVVGQCDGAKTWREHFESARTGSMIPETVTAEEFAGLLASLVRAGLVNFQTPGGAPGFQH